MSTLENRKLNPGPLYLVAAAVLWSMAGVLTKFIPWSATTVACMRGLIAAMIQMLYSRTFKIKITKPVLLTAICYLGETLLFTFANKMTSAGSAIVLQNTSPLYIMLMGLIILRQKPSKLDCCVGVVIFSGILLSILDTLRGGALPGSNPLLGNILALISGVFYAGIFFTSRLPGANALQSAILGNLMYIFFLPAFRSFLIQFTIFPLVKRAIIDPYYKEHPNEDIDKRNDLNLEVSEEEAQAKKEEPVFIDMGRTREREESVVPKQYSESELRRGKKLSRDNRNADDDGTI